MALTDKERKMRKSVGMSPNDDEAFISRRDIKPIAVSTLIISAVGYAPFGVMKRARSWVQRELTFTDENPGCHIEGFDDQDTGLPCYGGRVEPVLDNAEKGYFDVSEMLAVSVSALILSTIMYYSLKGIGRYVRQSETGHSAQPA